MISPRKTLSNLSVVGGSLCLDFVNTIDWRGRVERIDYLSGYEELVAWWHFIGLVKPREATRLTQKADRFSKDSGKALNRAVNLREAFYRIFKAVSLGNQVPQTDMEMINQHMPGSFPGALLQATDNTISTVYADRDKSFDWPLKAVVRSAVQALTTVEPERIKICGDAECGWLFLDKSKNKSRRWCNMDDCGNRAKAGRFYRKKKQADTKP